MTTPEMQSLAIEAGSPSPGERPVSVSPESVRSGLYVLSLLIAGVAILAALLAAIAAQFNLTNFAVIAVWVFVVAAGLWSGGMIYILSLEGKRLWASLCRTNNDRSAN